MYQLFLPPPAFPCVCGSGKPSDTCHRWGDRWLSDPFLVAVDPRPEAVRNERCYLSALGGCSPKLSGEHMFSRSLLGMIGDKCEVRGWEKINGGSPKMLGINALTVKALCTNHNAALSPLDGQIASFVQALFWYDSLLDDPTTAAKNYIHLESGDAVERWLLKVALGFSAAGALLPAITQDVVRRARIAEILAGCRPWPDGWGFYMCHTPDVLFAASSTYMVTADGIGEGEALLSVAFGPFTLFLSLGAQLSPSHFTRRPSHMVLERWGYTSQKVLALGWPTDTEPGMAQHLMRDAVSDGWGLPIDHEYHAVALPQLPPGTIEFDPPGV